MSETHDQLREQIAKALNDATGFGHETWADTCDVADEYELADALLPIVDGALADLRRELSIQVAAKRDAEAEIERWRASAFGAEKHGFTTPDSEVTEAELRQRFVVRLHEQGCGCGEWDSHSDEQISHYERIAGGLVAEVRMMGLWTARTELADAKRRMAEQDAVVGERSAKLGDARAEVDRLRTQTAQLPDDWRYELSRAMGPADAWGDGVDGWRRVCALVESWRPSTGATPEPRCTVPHAGAHSPDNAACLLHQDSDAAKAKAEAALALCILRPEDQIEYWPDCDRCEGTGRLHECPACDGMGKVRPEVSRCPACNHPMPDPSEPCEGCAATAEAEDGGTHG